MNDTNLPATSKRRVRRRLSRRRRQIVLLRWMALIDEVTRLERDIEGDAFTDAERAAFRSALDQLWMCLEWRRPKFPPLRPR